MKKLFNVKLYRSPLFKIIHVLILLTSLLCVLYGLCLIFVNLFNGISLYELFYKPYADSFLFEDVYFYAGTKSLIEFLFSIIFYVFVSIISFMSLVNNKIVVFDDYIKIRFVPRYLNKVINIKNITDISPVEREEVSVSQRILNFNFSKKHLYKITTKYQQTIIISCSDEVNLNKLKELIGNNVDEY